MIRKLTVFLVGLLAVCACSSIDCPVQHSVRTYYAVYNADQKADTLKDTLSVMIHRASYPDTLLLSTASNRTSFSLPVSYYGTVDTLYFLFGQKVVRAVDTVWVKKENIPHFESVDCIVQYFHHILEVSCTHHAIDSITINNPTVDYDPQAIHFHLYPKSRD